MLRRSRSLRSRQNSSAARSARDATPPRPRAGRGRTTRSPCKGRRKPPCWETSPTHGSSISARSPPSRARATSSWSVPTGPDGALHDYEIAYTFGVYPLQQYLIAFPGGRYQALGIAWDSRPKDQGGQRWFHLYPDQKLKPGDPLHWTGRDQTWNYQCADCHSTDLQKNYDLAANTYATSWTDLDVSCEACHGPGSRHVAWAKSQAAEGS